MHIGLTPEDHAWRREGLGGSDLNILLSGDQQQIDQLYRIKIGESDPIDLSDVLPVVMGTWTEGLNAVWYEWETGTPVEDRNAKIEHPDEPWRRCSLDGMVTLERGEGVWEAKHVNPFNFSMGATLAQYAPQLTWNMSVTNTDFAHLSVFVGTMRWEYTEYRFDAFYFEEIMQVAREFWECVQNRTPPNHINPIEPPPHHEQLRHVDMSNNEGFTHYAEIWRNLKPHSDQFKEAEKILKGSMPDDAELAYGCGVELKRDKRGGIRINPVF